MNLWSRVRSWFRRANVEADMSEEMRLHLEQRIQENVTAGLSPDEARRAALRRFGGVEQAKERCRAQRPGVWLEQAAQDLRFAARQLARTPLFTCVVVLSLALGIGANSAVFSFVHSMYFEKLPVRNPDELIAFQWMRTAPDGEPRKGGGGSPWADIDPETGREVHPEFSSEMLRRFRASPNQFAHVFGVASLWQQHVLIDGEAEILEYGEAVTGDYFSTLGVRAEVGRLLTLEDDTPDAPPVVAISHAYWASRFGRDPAVIGKTIVVNQVPVTIVGVAARNFEGMVYMRGSPALILPLSSAPRFDGALRHLNRPGHSWIRIVARLKGDATAEQAVASLQSAFDEEARAAGSNSSTRPILRATSAAQAYSAAARARSRVNHLTIAGLVVLVLAAACLNAANLLLARGAARRNEIAVRLALGASRGRVVRQLLAECLLLAALATAFGALFSRWGFSLVLFGQLKGPYTFGLNGHVVAFMTLLAIATALIFGLVPALRATRIDLTAEFHGGSRVASARGRGWIGGTLVVAQVALSLMLLVSAGLFWRTLQNLRAVDPGIDPKRLLLFSINLAAAGHPIADSLQVHTRLVDRISRLPGVRAVTYSSNPVLSNAQVGQSRVWIPGRESSPAREQGAVVTNVHTNFFETMGIPVVLGRAFDATDEAPQRRTVIVNAAFAAKAFPGENPIGRALNFNGENEIVGLVRDFREIHVRREPQPAFFRPASQAPMPWVAFAVRTAGDPLAMVPAVRQAIREIDRNVTPTWIRSQEKEIEGNLLAQERYATRLATFLGGVALILVCIGLYGLVAYSVARRTGEIGLRMALGGQPRDILRLVLGRATVLVALGVLFGIGGASALSRLITAKLYGVSPVDPAVYAGVAAILLCVTLVACIFPARRATKIDPMVALRAE